MTAASSAVATAKPVAYVQGYTPKGDPVARVVFIAGVDLPGAEFGKTPRADTVVNCAEETVPAARGTYQARKENAYDIVTDGFAVSVRLHGADWWCVYPMHMVKSYIPARKAKP